MDALIKEINAKLQLLALTEAKTKGIMEGGNMETIQRHLDALKGISKGVDDLKLQIEQAKITKGETPEEVIAWSGEIEAKLASIDQGVVGASKRLTELKTEANLAGQEVEEAALQKKRKEQLDFERAQLELKLEYDKKAADVNKHQSAPTKRDGAKLPKLTITKFNGTYEAWLPFWNKFIAEVDSVDLPAVTKFAYLKELVETKVQVGIDGLPFTTEGYERAKNILKSEYGKQSEIVNAYISNIMGLPVITSAHPKKIDEFYKKLLYNVQSLETLGRLRDVTGNVRAVLDKLKGIKADLVRGQVGWQDWDFPKLIEALHHWREINPAEEWESSHRHVKSFQAHERVRVCVYCSGSDHTPQDCRKVATLNERKRILSSKRLCFNCAAGRHRAGDCRSRSVCAKCGQRHHTSICDGAAQLMTATSSRDDAVVYPVVVVEVEGVRCRALLDTGAGSSYASATLLDRVGAKPGKRQVRKIEMMLGVDTREVELTHVKVASLEGDFRLTVEVTRVGKPTLLELENPKYREMLDRYSHLKGVKMLDEDTKTMLPVHLILGASEFARIKTEQGPRIGRPGEPVAEKTRFGWTIMSPGSEPDLSKMLLTQTSQADHESLCRLDVLGLQDPAVGDQEEVYREFREQLQQSPEGWYQTGLPWKGNHPPLPSNEGGSLRRLDSLLRKLERGNILNRYDNVIREQLNEGIVERVSGPPVGKEFYIPHKAVVRESAESTKLLIVYDASARASEKAPSLNECLHVGPPLQNKLWAVLVRARFQPVALTGDMKQAFLQIRIREEDRDTLRFHWISDLETKRVETFRFTRALFGLAPSPFLLAGVIKQHLESCRAKFPDLIREIDKSLYVDDLVSGGPTVREAQEIKAGAIDVFGQASIKLHKWHSNVPGLEAPEDSMSEETTFAKEQLGTPKAGGGSILGLTWNKNDDVLEIKFPADRASVTKRGVLGKIARVYDPLGLVSPMTLSGKLLYREACESKVAWDAQLPGELASKWTKWESQLPLNISVPRALPKHRERISNIELHGFGDASGRGISVAVYAIVSQPSGDSVGLVAAKSRLAKQGLTIPRLELVSGHMATNLIVNVKESLEGFPVGEMFCWLDSSVALHWIKGSGSYKQFVSNRVHKIQQHPELKWRHVSTKDNPADLGSRSGSVEKEKLWWSGPHWLLDRDLWPADIITTSTTESQAEAKVIREVFAVAQARTDILDILLTKHSLWRTLRICAWMIRFFGNSRKAEINRVKGPLTTEEINQQRLLWLRRVQGSFKNGERFEEHRLQLNLQENDNGLLECRGRIQGDYPIYVPDSHHFADKIVAEAHQNTLHGGVGLTMARVREQY